MQTWNILWLSCDLRYTVWVLTVARGNKYTSMCQPATLFHVAISFWKSCLFLFYVCEWLSACMYGCLDNVTEGIRSPGAGLVDSCELLGVGSETWTPMLCKNKCWSPPSHLSSPGSQLVFLIWLFCTTHPSRLGEQRKSNASLTLRHLCLLPLQVPHRKVDCPVDGALGLDWLHLNSRSSWRLISATSQSGDLWTFYVLKER